jgi:head-tail adaptor
MATRGLQRHLVTIEEPASPVPDGDGGFTEVWSVIGARWTHILPATARDLERFTASTIVATATHLLTMDYLAGVTTRSRVVFGSRRFSVQGVMNPEERNIDTILACAEVVA